MLTRTQPSTPRSRL